MADFLRETYRHASRRYSTGQGFNVNVDFPENRSEYASYKMGQLKHNLSRDEFYVDVRREADRVSMQMEAGEQIVKTMGFNSQAGKDIRSLKLKVEVLRHLMTAYPIQFIMQSDLQTLYKLYQKNSPAMDTLIKKVIQDNKDKANVKPYLGTREKFRKGYDDYGRELDNKDEKAFKLPSLGEFGDLENPGALISIVVVCAIGSYFYFQ